jgi:hypothetical protein
MRERELGAKQVALPTKRYGLIYADPPWKFAPFSVVTGMDLLSRTTAALQPGGLDRARMAARRSPATAADRLSRKGI